MDFYNLVTFVVAISLISSVFFMLIVFTEAIPSILGLGKFRKYWTEEDVKKEADLIIKLEKEYPHRPFRVLRLHSGYNGRSTGHLTPFGKVVVKELNREVTEHLDHLAVKSLKRQGLWTQ